MGEQTRDPVEMWVVTEDRGSYRRAYLTKQVRTTCYVPKSELEAARARIAELEELICSAGPLAWAASGDMDDARAWEVRAEALLKAGCGNV